MELTLRTLTLTVTCGGAPLPGASVQPVGTITKEQPWSSWSFHPQAAERLGIRGGITDAAGKVTITFLGDRPDATIKEVVVHAEHPDACAAQVDVNVDAPRPIVLRRGMRVRLAAQPPPGIVFIELFADIENEGRSSGLSRWKREDDGLALVFFLDNGKYLARLVGVTADQRHFFSAPTAFNIAPAGGGTANTDFSLPMHEGRTVTGSIDPSVPRPVTGGWLLAHVTSPKRVENACGLLSNRWDVAVDLRDDGSFTVPGLPEGTLELLAGCDGYVAANPGVLNNDGIRSARVMPDDEPGPFVLAMEPTGTARIIVLRPDGQPLSGVPVHLSPNQKLGRFTSLVGTHFSTIDLFRARFHNALEDFRKNQKHVHFGGKTDARGAIVVSGLPSGTHRIHVFSPDFEQPIFHDPRPLPPGGMYIPNRESRITIHPAQETTVEIRMEANGTTSLSAAIKAAQEKMRARCP